MTERDQENRKRKRMRAVAKKRGKKETEKERMTSEGEKKMSARLRVFVCEGDRAEDGGLGCTRRKRRGGRGRE